MKKIHFAVSFVIIICMALFNTVTAFAYNDADINNQSELQPSVLVVSDPETGRSWSFDISDNYLCIDSGACKGSTTNSDDPTQSTSEASIDIGEYIYQTLSANEKSAYDSGRISTVTDEDMTITIGMTYTFNSSTGDFSMKTVFGSTVPSGLYYAENKKVYWGNPGAWVNGTYHGSYSPSSNSWNYTLPNNLGPVISAAALPYVLLDCEVHVSGMSAYRAVHLFCWAQVA